MEGEFNSRRSTVYSKKGIVSSTQPLANAAGIKILSRGGNCVDACAAVSVCLSVLEPSSTGIGGDCFGIFYDSNAEKVHGINGTGRSASKISIEWLKENHPDHILPSLRFQPDSVFKVQIPGHIAGICDAVEKWGSGVVSLEDILSPAIELAESGYPVSQVSAHLWQGAEKKLKKENKDRKDLEIFLPNEGLKGPIKGQVVRNIPLANVLKKIAKEGKKGFYEGDVAKSIVEELSKRGSLISEEDLSNHTSTFVTPINIEALGYKLWEIPPNGSGLIALLTLGLIQELDNANIIDLKSMEHNSAEYLHVIIECLKLSFKDSDEYVNDYEYFSRVHGIDHHLSIAQLLGNRYLKERIKLFKKDKIINNKEVRHGIPDPMFKSDTVYFTATDSKGNACSFISSLYENFGSGILVPGKGFALHNRGGNFNLNPTSKNCLAGNKRPYHTIIPGLITKSQDNHELLYSSYGIMGGYNQPQAHVQVYLNMLLFDLDPQEALDAPRISLSPHPDYENSDLGLGADGPTSRDVTCVNIEHGIAANTVKELREMGHEVKVLEGNDRKVFGRGQIIKKEYISSDEFVYSGGSDLRGDGASTPLL